MVGAKIGLKGDILAVDVVFDGFSYEFVALFVGMDAVLADPLPLDAAQLAHRADRAVIEAAAVVVAVLVCPFEQQVRGRLRVARQVVDDHAHGGRAAAGGG